MTTPTPSTPSNTQRWFQVAVVALLSVAVGFVAFFVLSDDGTETTETTVTIPAATITTATDSTEVTTTPEDVTTTDTPPVTEPVTEPPAMTVDPELYATAVWPLATTTVRYDTPEEAVQGFAEDFAGFTEPLIGEFMLGDSRSGEFEVRATADGPLTVVFVRQLGPDDSWWILGSVSDNITDITEPATLDSVTSPLVVSSGASAFEGQVRVILRADGTDELLVDSFVIGGSTGPGPFTGTFTFDSPGEGYGALAFLINSPEDGRLTEVTTLRVRFVDK